MFRQRLFFSKKAFGVDNNNFPGTELNFDLWLNDIRSFFGFPSIFGEKIRGLTTGQFIIGGSVRGKVLKDKF